MDPTQSDGAGCRYWHCRLYRPCQAAATFFSTLLSPYLTNGGEKSSKKCYWAVVCGPYSVEISQNSGQSARNYCAPTGFTDGRLAQRRAHSSPIFSCSARMPAKLLKWIRSTFAFIS